MVFRFGRTSKRNLKGIHPILKYLAEEALKKTEVDFGITEGGRSDERQLKLWRKKRSKLNGIPHGQIKDGIKGTGVSRHQLLRAIDIVAYDEDGATYDWPAMFEVIKAFRVVCVEHEIKAKWGGVWDRMLHELDEDLEEEVANYVLRRKEKGKKAFIDGPHIQIEV